MVVNKDCRHKVFDLSTLHYSRMECIKRDLMLKEILHSPRHVSVTQQQSRVQNYPSAEITAAKPVTVCDKKYWE